MYSRGMPHVRGMTVPWCGAGGNDDTGLKSTIRAEINELAQHKLKYESS